MSGGLVASAGVHSGPKARKCAESRPTPTSALAVNDEATESKDEGSNVGCVGETAVVDEPEKWSGSHTCATYA
jgi:hypothetical protein